MSRSFDPAGPTRAAHGDGAARRRALVTGASSGIGRAFAERLAGEGYDLILVARSTGRLEALAAELRKESQVEAEVLAADLTEPEQLRQVEARISEEPDLALLVNNAGFGTVGRFPELPPDGEETEVRLNVIAVLRLTRAALPGMIERGAGGIINVSSMAALQPSPYTATYGATKAFVNSFTEALHEEIRGSGVRVQALCPGFTRTEFQERAGVQNDVIPSFAWMEPAAVVEASLEGLRRGVVVCVPGRANQATAALVRLAPRGLSARVAASLVRRGID